MSWRASTISSSAWRGSKKAMASAHLIAGGLAQLGVLLGFEVVGQVGGGHAGRLTLDHPQGRSAERPSERKTLMPLVPRDRENEVLHRISFRILRWIITVTFGLVATGLLISLNYSFKGGPLLGVAACFFVIMLAQRFMGSRIVLNSSTVTIVNPVMNYRIPYGAVSSVHGGGGGTLILATREGKEIYAVGFGGSMIDGIFKTTDKSIERIEMRIRKKRGSGQNVQTVKSFRVSWIADFCTVGALTCVVIAGIIGI
ncbi:hypothetical protein ABZ307_38120 [Streptomyces griseorubiginosus]|uniref:hypothetical protein n=1 Tax=Streptomyces griseorubiginosus TaxID=67304 RepID=UPI0033AE9BF0